MGNNYLKLLILNNQGNSFSQQRGKRINFGQIINQDIVKAWIRKINREFKQLITFFHFYNIKLNVLAHHNLMITLKKGFNSCKDIIIS